MGFHFPAGSLPAYRRGRPCNDDGASAARTFPRVETYPTEHMARAMAHLNTIDSMAARGFRTLAVGQTSGGRWAVVTDQLQGE